MPARPRTRADDEKLSMAELVAELRESRRCEAELLAVLHRDGEARTREGDHARPSWVLSAATPLLLGILVGALAAYSASTGRMSTLEAENRQYAGALASLRSDQKETLTLVRQVQSDIRSLAEKQRR